MDDFGDNEINLMPPHIILKTSLSNSKYTLFILKLYKHKGLKKL